VEESGHGQFESTILSFSLGNRVKTRRINQNGPCHYRDLNCAHPKCRSAAWLSGNKGIPF